MVYETWFVREDERSAFVQRWRWALRMLLWPVRHHSVLSFPPPPVRHVFEFGAGTGNDLAEFHAAGWTVSGCEPSAHAYAAAARLHLAAM
jgi:SAM-dependent methyltransferase